MTVVEDALLGAMLISQESLSLGITMLEENDFTDDRPVFFRAIKENMVADGGKSVVTYLHNEGLLERVGGVPRIEAFINLCSSTTFTPSWIKTVKKASMLRKIDLAGDRLKKLSRDGYSDDIVRKASTILTQSFSNEDAGISTLKDAAINEYDRVKDKEEIKRFTSVYKTVNAHGGFYAHSDISAMVGKTGIGKTWAILKEAVYQVKNDSDVLFVPLEMSKDALVRRVFTQELAIPQNALFDCSLDATGLGTLKTFISNDYLDNFYIARNIQTPSEIELMATWILNRSKNNRLFIVIDPAILAQPDRITNNPTTDARAFWDGMKQTTNRLSESSELVSTLIAHHLTKLGSAEDKKTFNVEDMDTAGHHNISLGLILERTSEGVVMMHCVKNRHGLSPWTVPMVWRHDTLSFDDMKKLCPLCAADSVHAEMQYFDGKWKCSNGHSS